jgi:hypothetical protein
MRLALLVGPAEVHAITAADGQHPNAHGHERFQVVRLWPGHRAVMLTAWAISSLAAELAWVRPGDRTLT